MTDSARGLNSNCVVCLYFYGVIKLFSMHCKPLDGKDLDGRPLDLFDSRGQYFIMTGKDLGRVGISV